MERPLRLDFQASPERIARLDDQRAFVNLARVPQEGPSQTQGRGGGPREAGRNPNSSPESARPALPGSGCLRIRALRGNANCRAETHRAYQEGRALRPVRAKHRSCEVCRDRKGRPEPDPQLRDTENVPLLEDVESFFEREVKPHVPDAWIDSKRRDPHDGKVGLVGYEINFNRYFYEYRPPRPLEEIEADIRRVEKEIAAMLEETRG